MKRIISIISAMLMFCLNLFVFAAGDTAELHNTETEEKIYPAITVKYPEIFSKVMDDHDNAFAEETEISGFDVIKVVANPYGEHRDIVTLDNYDTNLESLGIDLEVYKYITVIYKYDGNVPDNVKPGVYICTHSGEIVGGAVPTLVSTKSFTGGWNSSVFMIPELKYLHPEYRHILNHFHLNPFGRSIKAPNLSPDATIYVQGVIFHQKNDIEIEVLSPYIQGKDDGTFAPNELLTRAQACSIACKVMGVEDAASYTGSTSFDDVKKDEWYYGYVAYSEKAGLLGAFGENFGPDEYIKTDEFFDIILKTTITIPEAAKLPSGNGTLNFANSEYITRAQAVAFVNTVYGKNMKLDTQNLKSPFSDVASSVWSFNDIILAGSSHAYMKEHGSDEYVNVYKGKNYEELSNEIYELGEAKLAEVEKLERRRIIEIKNHESTVSVTGTSYYFSEYGNDSNSGTIPEEPKRTLDALNNLNLLPGDGVFFKRGETFRGSIIAKKGVTYSSYGDYGEKPVLMASPANFAGASNWVETDTPNVWMLTTPIMHDVGLVVFNDGEAWSEKRIKGHSDFMTGDLADLDKDLTMWHDVSAPVNVSGYLYLRSDEGNPGARFHSIEVSPRNNIIKAADDILVDNLCFKYTGAHGIGSGSIKNLTVKNCEFYFIGGSWFRTDTLSRYGNAVEVYGSCDGYVVDNCYITQVYDAGVTHQLSDSPDTQCIMKDIKYTNNVITDTSYPIEYFIGIPNDGVEHKMVNYEISGNIIMRTGMGFGDQRPDKSAATAIKGWNTYNEAYNYTITNNIFALSKYYMMATGASDNAWTPVCDSNTYIQYYYGKFGTIRMGTQSNYDSNVKEFIMETSGDKNAQVYYIRPLAEE